MIFLILILKIPFFKKLINEKFTFTEKSFNPNENILIAKDKQGDVESDEYITELTKQW